jgi:hypothetical protein
VINLLVLAAAVLLAVAVLFKSLGGALTMSVTPNVQKIAEAIAFAEGFYVAGSRPARNHNPGDMTADLIGKSVGHDGPFVVYSTDDDGWENLRRQISLWLYGGSSHATPDSTITDLSEFYTTTDQTAWAANVANHLGVSTDTSIGEIA